MKGVNDFVNNVVYNWGGGGAYIAGGDSAGQSYANIMNNVFISGPSTSVLPFTRGNANFHAYVQRNYYDPSEYLERPKYFLIVWQTYIIDLNGKHFNSYANKSTELYILGVLDGWELSESTGNYSVSSLFPINYLHPSGF